MHMCITTHTSSSPPDLFTMLWLFWRCGGSRELFAWAGLELRSSWSQPPK
jgi:hypothetical protein